MALYAAVDFYYKLVRDKTAATTSKLMSILVGNRRVSSFRDYFPTDGEPVAHTFSLPPAPVQVPPVPVQVRLKGVQNGLAWEGNEEGKPK